MSRLPLLTRPCRNIHVVTSNRDLRIASSGNSCYGTPKLFLVPGEGGVEVERVRTLLTSIVRNWQITPRPDGSLHGRLHRVVANHPADFVFVFEDVRYRGRVKLVRAPRQSGGPGTDGHPLVGEQKVVLPRRVSPAGHGANDEAEVGNVSFVEQTLTIQPGEHGDEETPDELERGIGERPGDPVMVC
jgi:hypothetical protein